MTENQQKKVPVLIAGDAKVANSVAICLLLAHQPVVVLTQHSLQTAEILRTHIDDINSQWNISVNMDDLTIVEDLDGDTEFSLAIAITTEDLSEKKALIHLFENILPASSLIAVNMESINLGDIQDNAKHPERIIGVNWVEPAHTTYFLEIISNENNDVKLVNDFVYTAKQYWKKDPYLITTGLGIRARLICALVREAFYLVENGYVSFDDIDRACRNDAGYYLPFAGNFRYMDLMGTYIYGIVMKDMNPDLTRQRHVPQFFKEIVQQGGLGMENNHGFYEYHEGEVKKWETLFRKFSYQVSEIIGKYH